MSKYFILFSLLLTGCAVIPKYAKQTSPESCDLYTKELELEVLNHSDTVGLAHCSGSSCGAALAVSAGVFVSSVVVSGSIYLVGNTLHWLEKESRCSDEDVIQETEHYDEILQAVGGEKIASQTQLTEALETTSTKLK